MEEKYLFKWVLHRWWVYLIATLWVVFSFMMGGLFNISYFNLSEFIVGLFARTIVVVIVIFLLFKIKNLLKKNKKNR